MKLLEPQFQNILCYYMMSYWSSVEVKNPFPLAEQNLMLVAREYAPKEDQINDWFGKYYSRGVDLILMNECGDLSLVEMKKESRDMQAVLRQVAQAYEGALYLQKIPVSRLETIFEESFRLMYAAIEGRGPKIFKDEKNHIMAVHQRYFQKEEQLKLHDIKSMLPKQLILTLNPNEKFPESVSTLKNISAFEVIERLSSSDEDRKCRDRLAEVCSSDISIPVEFVEFEMTLSGSKL